ncbi:hypothetical protein ACHAWU_006739 [Discostella pseudostelligera]|uniref:Selenide, water dikinase n=1 Tax=Discostella pseudostelligera TaxID=259834 RepID=A0ABD3NC05_9STRA
MLSSLHLGDGNNIGTHNGKIALDCSIRQTRQGHVCISTTDFFFPLLDSPYLTGRIGAANVLSDLYAEGVGHCDFVLMLLAACRDMNEDERNICTTEMVRGFNDACLEAETVVTGGQTVYNPWPIIGGVATAIVRDEEYVKSNGAQVGDVVVLTKALGTQVAVNVHEWRVRSTVRWMELMEQKVLTLEMAEDMMHAAACSMSRLNRHGGALMLKYGAHAGTDVTGFGLLGHAQNLMDNQEEEVGMEIHTLPVIANTSLVETSGIFNFRLLEGYSAETSGGLLICLPEENAKAYIAELEELDGGEPAWIVGKVVSNAERKANIVEDVKILQV